MDLIEDTQLGDVLEIRKNGIDHRNVCEEQLNAANLK
jgi:hypothetical protein